MRAVPTTTPSAVGSAPPESPVPAPRGTTGTPSPWSTRTTPASSSVVAGSTTALGATRYWVSPSDSYTKRRSGSVIT